jgi:hypothetical protein
MPGTITLGIEAVVTGDENLTRLEKELQRLQDVYDRLKATAWEYSEATQIVSAQNRNEIQALKNSNVMLKAKANLTDDEIKNLAVQKNLERDLTAEIESRMAIQSRALDIQRMSKQPMSDDYARYLAEESLAVEAAEAKKAAALYRTTQALKNASISMFVMNITMQQLVGSLKPFVKGNKDAEKSLKDVSAALQFSMAPLQMFMSYQMISKQIAEEQKMAYLGVASALGAMFFWYSAITAKSPAMRAAYAAIATVLTAVAIASWAAAYGTAAMKAALTGNIVPLIVVVGAMAAAMAGIAAVTAPKAQTLTGHRKRVRKGGMAELDDDEVVQRVSKDGSKNGGGGNINIYLPEGYNGSMADAKITAHSVKRMMNSGYGSVKYTRKVVTGG